MNKKNKNTCKYLKYTEYLLILSSTIIICVPFSTFPSLICVPVGIITPAVGIQLKHKLIIKKKEKKKHDKMVLLEKHKLITIEVPNSKTLIEFVSVNDLLREYNEMRLKKIQKKSEKYVEYPLWI